MFAREQRRSHAPAPVVRRRYEPASISGAPSSPMPSRQVCPCGGGCPRCSAKVSHLSPSDSGPLASMPDHAQLHQESEPDSSPPAVQELLRAPGGNQESNSRAPLAPVHLPWPMQAKLEVGAVDDPLEREADRVADHVMRMPEPMPVNPKTSAPPKKTEAEAPPIVHEVLHSPGQPLDAATRAFFEPRFGHDFSGVRIHTRPEAAASARSINAHAYTVGADIVFGSGQYAPDTPSGRALIAHELAHTLQSSGRVRRQSQHIDITDSPATKVGLQNAANLEVEKWRNASHDGIQNYINSKIFARLNDLEKKRGEEGRKEFLLALADVLVALIPGGAEAEEAEGALKQGKKVAEIAIKFAYWVTHIPEGPETPGELSTKLKDAVDKEANEILLDIPDLATAILLDQQGITQYQALARLLKHYFTDKPIEVIGGQEGVIQQDSPPRLNPTPIAHRMEHAMGWAAFVAEKSLSARLEEKEPGNNITGNIRTEVAYVQAPDGNIRVALLQTDYSLYRLGTGNRGQPRFMEWVPVGKVEASLALQFDKFKEQRTYTWQEVKLFMVPERPPELIEWLKTHGAPL